jgi:methionyl aminopeptidase
MNTKITIHDKEDFVGMKKAGKLAADTLAHIEQYIEPGISTEFLNNVCHDFIAKHNGVPAPLNYRGFPKSICTSVNHVVCHGIPSISQVLQDGDIVNVDVTVILDGWHGDTSKTFKVGPSFANNNPRTLKASKLVEVAHEAMWHGINAVKPYGHFSDIGSAIQKFVENKGFSVVREYCGHGIGRVFHDNPNVLHYLPSPKEAFADQQIRPGMFFTIEPMVNAGRKEVFLSKVDKWTVFTKDGSLSAQFEHTIGVLSDGCEVFTSRDK